MTDELPRELVTGIDLIDSQHRELLRLGRELMLLLKERSTPDVAFRVLTMLTGYAQTHFGIEEEWMERLKYPHRAEHAAAHSAFKQELRLLEQEVSEQGFASGLDRSVRLLLPDLLLIHIRKHDTRLASFLRERGIPAQP
jgi:hemerythrin